MKNKPVLILGLLLLCALPIVSTMMETQSNGTQTVQLRTDRASDLRTY